jgi:hypothetical protein
VDRTPSHGTARKTAQAFVNEGDATSAGFPSLRGEDEASPAESIEAVREQVRGHRREAVEAALDGKSRAAWSAVAIFSSN